MVPDFLIVGGGPAGCAAATLLAKWGHQVRLITRAASGTPSLGESIPPSSRKLFDLLGVGAAVDAAGFVRTTGNTVWWGGGDARVERFARGERGWQATTAAVERVLLEHALATGVQIERRRVSADEGTGAGAPMMLDCSGRAGVFARVRDWRVYEPAHRTIALVGVWNPHAVWAVPDPTHTLIESYENGWAWSVPLDDRRRQIAVMVDPAASELERGRPARDVYLTEIAKTKRFADLVRTATLESGPAGWDASMYFAKRYCDDRLLLVGDAGSFIDPLSSAGVKKGLASGWLAAVVAHTCRVRPAMRRHALDFFDAREREIYVRFRQLTSQYLSEAAAGHSHPFWNDRAALDTDQPTRGTKERVVRAAFERLKNARSIHLRRSPALRIEERPAISSCEVVLEPRVVSGTQDEGVRYVSDVDAIGLIELAPTVRQVPDLFDAYCRRYAPVALPDFLTALATVVARGWLRDSPE